MTSKSEAIQKIKQSQPDDWFFYYDSLRYNDIQNYVYNGESELRIELIEDEPYYIETSENENNEEEWASEFSSQLFSLWDGRLYCDDELVDEIKVVATGDWQAIFPRPHKTEDDNYTLETAEFHMARIMSNTGLDRKHRNETDEPELSEELLSKAGIEIADK